MTSLTAAISLLSFGLLLCTGSVRAATARPPLTAASGQGSGENACIVPIGDKRQFRYQWPLIYHDNEQKTQELFATTQQMGGDTPILSVTLPAGAKAILACGPNYLKRYRGILTMRVQCNGNTGNLTVPNPPAATSDHGTLLPEELNIRDLTCDLRVVEEVVRPVEGCASTLTSSHFGYVHPQGKTHVLGEACYDTREGRTHFAHVQLGPEPYLHTEDGRYLTGRHPDGRYKIELFRNLHFDEIYSRLREELHTKDVPQLHMANYVDERLLHSAQLQAVKKLSWNYFVALDHNTVLDQVKETVQRYAAGGSDNLDVFVGSHGVKTLHAGDITLPLYLHVTQRFPVPEYVWLLVQKGQRGVVFLVPNEDHSNAVVGVATTTSTPPLCHSECERIKWLAELNAAPAGLLCCSYEDARRVVKEMPAGLQLNDLLV